MNDFFAWRDRIGQERVQAMADEAEAGYDPAMLRDRAIQLTPREVDQVEAALYWDETPTPDVASLLQDRDQWRDAALTAEGRVRRILDDLSEYTDKARRAQNDGSGNHRYREGFIDGLEAAQDVAQRVVELP